MCSIFEQVLRGRPSDFRPERAGCVEGNGGPGLGLALVVTGFKLIGVRQHDVLRGLVDEAFLVESREEAGDRFGGETGHAAELFVGELHGK